MIFVWIVLVVLAIMWLGIVAVGPPYVPTLRKGLDELFDKLTIGKNDAVVDLGAGDGIVLKLAAERGARVAGVELNPMLVWIARWRLRHHKHVSVTFGDMWRYKLPQNVTYVFIFPADAFMRRLESYAKSERERLGHGFTLIVYAFTVPGRKPSRVVGAFNLYEF
jgi:SAM-dependent methyltransferase